MATYPNAEWRPLAAGSPGATMDAHDVVCVHTMVGFLAGTESMFRQDGWTGTERTSASADRPTAPSTAPSTSGSTRTTRRTPTCRATTA